MSVENCEKDKASSNEREKVVEEEEDVQPQQHPSLHEDKDQEYIIHLENELSQAEIERQKAIEEADNNMNKLRYLMADFDNFRKQTERQIESKINQGKAELILKFVAIHDDLFRAIVTAKQCKSDHVVIEGLEGILRNVETLFDAEGVKEIETTGTPFDPNIHDAISFKYDDSVPENTVIGEIRKGYMISNKVLRPSLVEISKRIVKNSAIDSNRTKGD
ncbi:MAG TPA: nucleotide exchange factor GrpE [Nitrososphaeraceae archaeon]|nr:nucleotide exchange factor GrpE [Nitrososphaeraceae archaeon]